MFRKKKKIKPETALEDALNQEMIVHNMPKDPKLSGAYSSGSSPISANEAAPPSESQKNPTKSRSNFKAVGFIIMASGVVVIAALVYLSYRFIIAPAAQDKTPNMPIAADNGNSATTVPITSDLASTTELSTATPAVVDLATTTVATSSEKIASSTNPLFPDSDYDGLNDGEEAILGTSPTMNDSDSDGYSDFAEVISGYDPSGSGKISANANLASYTNKTFNYDILYPKLWPIQALNDNATVIFNAPDNSLIQISVQDNPDQASILDWYEQSFPGTTVTYDQVRSTYSWEGIMGESGLNFYITDKNRKNIIVISYIPAVEGRIAYPTIFQLMINSLFIK